jgi:hypothetical protein
MSKLLQIIALLYRMTDEDTQALENELLAAKKRAWRTTIEDEARQMGYNIRARNPSGVDLRELKAQAKADAKSITQTWHKDVERQLAKLFKANPRGNRAYYAKNMEAWAAKRATWKDASIALNSEMQTIQYAKSRFWQNNGLRGDRFAAGGPAPTCKICIRIFGAGVVTYAYTQRHPFPAHVNCPHSYVRVGRAKVPLDQLWIG